MTKRSNRKKTVPGVTIWERYNGTFTYRVTGDPDPLTGEKKRPSRGGFATYAEALEEALSAKQRLETGRPLHTRKVRVKDYFPEWLSAVEPNLKETTAQNYRDWINGYIVPTLGERWIGDLTVPVINAFYKHLHESGRRKADTNSKMYAYWLAHKDERDGLGPTGDTVAKACGMPSATGRKAVGRYRRGRIPKVTTPGLEPKTIRNIHVVMNLALADAVRWGHLHSNPAEHAIVPRRKRKPRGQAHDVWTVEQLARWLAVALRDRYDGMWLLASTTGMRRSEIAGIRRWMLDLENGTLAIGDTRVVVAGRSRESDGKSEAGNRPISLDPFTVSVLRRYVARIDEEREARAEAPTPDDYLMVGPEGRPLHPDTITSRFNRVVDRAGCPRIRLHDVRHTYSTMALDAQQNLKVLSERIGHADPSVTLRIYTHKSPGRDRGVADFMGDLIKQALGTVDPSLVTDTPENGHEDPPPGVSAVS